MAYISASEFVLTLPNQVGTITGSSTPLSISEVATICERISDELDSAAAAAGYAVPITPTTATQALAQMALWNLYGAAAWVLGDLFPGGGQGAVMQRAVDYQTAYRLALAALSGGSQPLIGAAADSSGQGRELARSYSTSFPLATAGVVPQSSVGDRY